MKRFFIPLTVFTCLASINLNAQPNFDTTKVYVEYTPFPVIVDGSSNDSCWKTTNWHPIDKVWIPYAASISKDDFEGEYKAVWDSNYLYLLVKVTDDSLADYYSDPLSNWWNDDCVEIFIDEDRSKGYHECSYNAFAYHVSIFYDAIDMSTSCGGINLKNNLTVVIDTIAPKTYLWEFAIKIYNKNFNPQKPENSRVKLFPGKRMGFALAYCDYDGNSKHERENFIGSIFMPAAHNNDNYRTADYLGEMLLVDTKNLWDGSPVGIQTSFRPDISFSYNNKTNALIIDNIFSDVKGKIQVYSMDGKMVYQNNLKKNHLVYYLPKFPNGTYLVKISSEHIVSSGKIIIN
ncbi:MAG: T9SS type A sorting domain-containing protein [Bacteroidales bacterium]|nr:T9SS type A sorting domain-containing protein [Bacteroidales bacterium]